VLSLRAIHRAAAIQHRSQQASLPALAMLFIYLAAKPLKPPIRLHIIIFETPRELQIDSGAPTRGEITKGSGTTAKPQILPIFSGFILVLCFSLNCVYVCM